MATSHARSFENPQANGQRQTPFQPCAPTITQFTRLGIQNPVEMLNAMQGCRSTMLKVLTESRNGGAADDKMAQVIESLDDLIEELTGDRDSLWKGGA